MPRFAANLTLLWPELPVLERFRAAASAGFRRVEILFVHELDPAAVERELRENALELVLFDPRAGDWAKGDRGLLALPGREGECLAAVRAAIEAAKRFGTRQLNVLAGALAASSSREQAFAVATANLRAAAELALAAGLTLLIENINDKDIPGYFVRTPAEAAALLQAVGSPALKLQLDQYHAGMMGLDARAELRTHLAHLGHVQIADVPGRNQPGTGAQPIAAFLAELDVSGYAGAVGLEYRPKGSMEEALAWLPRTARG